MTAPTISEPGPQAAVCAPIGETTPWRGARHRYVRNKVALVAGAVFVLVVLSCLFGPVVSPYDPNRVDLSLANQTPSWDHPLGTDRFGRDLLTRTALAGQTSIGIGFAAALAILVIGIAYGSIAGFLGGSLDNAMMRLLDTLHGLPYLPFAIITLAVVGEVDFWAMTIALAIASWFTTARIVRGQIEALKEDDYIRAARALGARWHRVLRRHMLPNMLGVLVVAVFLELPGLVLGEAVLSFVGLGIGPPDASWGSMAADGRVVHSIHPHLIVIPSVAIATLTLCASLIAAGLRDALDPRTKETAAARPTFSVAFRANT